jgi:hypothetical protein
MDENGSFVSKAVEDAGIWERSSERVRIALMSLLMLCLIGMPPFAF